MEISQSFLASRTSSGSGTVCLQELLTELTKMMNVMAKYQHDNDDDGKTRTYHHQRLEKCK